MVGSRLFYVDNIGLHSYFLNYKEFFSIAYRSPYKIVICLNV